MIYYNKMNNNNFKNIKYKWIYNPVDKNLLEETVCRHNMPKPVAELMLKKGISSPDDIETFFNGTDFEKLQTQLALIKSFKKPF